MANRREALGLIGAMGASVALGMPGLRAQATPRVQLIVIRKNSYHDRCTRCIPGRIFGVPNNISLQTAEVSSSLLTALTDVIEPSYEENVPDMSAIPVGTYPATIRQDGTKKWMWSGGAVGSGQLLMDRAWRLELSNVPADRTNIQFHYGKDAAWSKGCVIVGKQPSNQCVDECKFADSPVEGVRAIRSYVEANMIASNTPIVVRIADGTI